MKKTLKISDLQIAGLEIYEEAKKKGFDYDAISERVTSNEIQWVGEEGNGMAGAQLQAGLEKMLPVFLRMVLANRGLDVRKILTTIAAVHPNNSNNINYVFSGRRNSLHKDKKVIRTPMRAVTAAELEIAKHKRELAAAKAAKELQKQDYTHW